MTKNEFKEIVKIMEKQVGRNMPEDVQAVFWGDMGNWDFETVRQQLSQIKTDDNGNPLVNVVINGASEELTKEVNEMLNTLLTTEAGDYVMKALEKFVSYKNKEEWKKEKKEYFKSNNYTNISLN